MPQLLNHKSSLCFVIAVICVITSVNSIVCGAIIVDQQGPTVNSGGLGNDPIVQSFTPAFNNVAGGSVFLSGTGALSGDVTISLYDGLPAFGGNLMATGFNPNVPRNTNTTVTWSPVAVNIGQTYYFAYNTPAALQFGVLHANPYANGQVFEDGGLINNFPTFDVVFQSLADDTFVPEPATLAVITLGLLALSRRRICHR